MYMLWEQAVLTLLEKVEMSFTVQVPAPAQTSWNQLKMVETSFWTCWIKLKPVETSFYKNMK